MLYRKRNELTIIDLSESNSESISLGVIDRIVQEKLSNVIYFEIDGKLHGIISMGDVGRAVEKGENFVAVNRNFTYLLKNEFMRARSIFKEKDAINAIPVTNANGELLGEYLRWDDLIMLEAYLQGGRFLLAVDLIISFWYVLVLCLRRKPLFFICFIPICCHKQE